MEAAAEWEHPSYSERKWRLEHLLELGLAPRHAEVLIDIPDVHHSARALVGAGCPPELAYRILRPAS